MKKVLVLGSTGMMGHMIKYFLEDTGAYIVYGTSREQRPSEKNTLKYNAKNIEESESLIKKVDPDYVINCLGVLIAYSEAHPDKAILLNSYLPWLYDKLSKKYHFKFIHLSTDCVFSGKSGMYKESCLPDETNYYGRTRALGELNASTSLTIRTSTIGPEIKNNGVGLLHWFLSQQGEVSGYDQVYWTGVSTLEMAKFIHHLISKEVSLSGIYHLVNDAKISKYELLKLFRSVFDRPDIQIKRDSLKMIDKSLINTRNDIDYTVPSYVDMIQDLKRWCVSKDRYKHYFDKCY